MGLHLELEIRHWAKSSGVNLSPVETRQNRLTPDLTSLFVWCAFPSRRLRVDA